eukprot:TRINITY_DN3748_c0_g1_i2.p1 TRINITY_DN3748_c0_g1~~TRINITY_DN3748_c0_g1_i2.p1  ORF type:complete len:335 (-),score=-3.88 TRINITY_DN3748_c0_g1_i2:56-967(-)
MDRSERITALLVQYCPIYKDPQATILKVDKLLSAYNESSKIDLVIFPEMAFTGYVFSSKADIEPYLETAGSGPSFEYCSSLAKRLDAYIFCGYPEKAGHHYYNSLMVVSPQGKLLKSYHKHFLYVTDKTWAEEGAKFDYIDIALHGGKTKKRVGLGICMDINPYEFMAPFKEFEFATFHAKCGSDVIVFSANWEADDKDFSDPCISNRTQTYWAKRLSPLIGHKCHFLAANRTGIEKPSHFVGTFFLVLKPKQGSSCAIRLESGSEILAKMNHEDEGTIIVSFEQSLFLFTLTQTRKQCRVFY